MLDIASLKPIKLRDLEAGKLYLPVEAHYERFLGGQINQYHVAIALDGEDPFQLAQSTEWSRPVGLLASDWHFEVDVDSAKSGIEVSDVSGSLILASNGQFLIGHQGRARYSIALQAKDDQTDPTDPMVGFSKWRIVWRQGKDSVTLYDRVG